MPARVAVGSGPPFQISEERADAESLWFDHHRRRRAYGCSECPNRARRRRERAEHGSGVRQSMPTPPISPIVGELRATTPRDANTLEAAIDRVVHHNRDGRLRAAGIAYGPKPRRSPKLTCKASDAAAYYGRDAVIWAVNRRSVVCAGLRGGNEATRPMLDSAKPIHSASSAFGPVSGIRLPVQRQRWANSVAPQQRSACNACATSS